jgi:hypothetical protein
MEVRGKHGLMHRLTTTRTAYGKKQPDSEDTYGLYRCCCLCAE